MSASSTLSHHRWKPVSVSVCAVPVWESGGVLLPAPHHTIGGSRYRFVQCQYGEVEVFCPQHSITPSVETRIGIGLCSASLRKWRCLPPAPYHTMGGKRYRYRFVLCQYGEVEVFCLRHSIIPWVETGIGIALCRASIGKWRCSASGTLSYHRWKPISVSVCAVPVWGNGGVCLQHPIIPWGETGIGLRCAGMGKWKTQLKCWADTGIGVYSACVDKWGCCASSTMSK